MDSYAPFSVAASGPKKYPSRQRDSVTSASVASASVSGTLWTCIVTGFVASMFVFSTMPPCFSMLRITSASGFAFTSTVMRPQPDHTQYTMANTTRDIVAMMRIFWRFIG